MTQTTGQALTATLRHIWSVGPRTRRIRKGQNLHQAMVQSIEEAAQYPGFYSQPHQDNLAAASGVAYSYRKHVEGYRISGLKIAAINAMTPWQFAAFLGQMVDAGIENAGQGERYLNGWAA